MELATRWPLAQLYHDQVIGGQGSAILDTTGIPELEGAAVFADGRAPVGKNVKPAGGSQ